MENSLFTEILTNYRFKYIIDQEDNKISIPIGIGDILFKILFLQQQLIPNPIYINLDIFITGKLRCNKNLNIDTWFNNYLNNFTFKIKMLNDICENSNFIKKDNIVFFSNKSSSSIEKVVDNNFNYRELKNFNLSVTPNFFNYQFKEKILDFVKDPFVIFHTKLRLNKKCNYHDIKNHLRLFFSGLKIKKFNIILMGEKTFKQNTESKLHGITTIYSELLNLYNYNSNKILDLTKENIYDELNYDEYKNDICLINKAEYNICYGQGGQLCTSLVFGKTIFFDPCDIEFFYKNINLYNSGHRYFKKLFMINKYLLEIL
jgi:hypothetical protein